MLNNIIFIFAIYFFVSVESISIDDDENDKLLKQALSDLEIAKISQLYNRKSLLNNRLKQSIHLGYYGGRKYDLTDRFLQAAGLCTPLVIPNAVIRYRKRNRVAKIRCSSGFIIMGGDRRLTCIRQKWQGRIPHCISSGCHEVSIQNGESIKLYSDALVHFSCHPGYQLQGSPSVFCDGVNWNDTAPTCVIPDAELYHTSCNFEFRLICGWIQDHLDDYDWKYTSGIMNSVTGNLGAKKDHTLQKSYGHYIYADANENWGTTSTARIFSPMLLVPVTTPSCVSFWYHMNGPTTGRLKVYLKPQTMPFEIMIPQQEIFGDHKDKWNRLILHINDITDDWFQVVLEACGGSGFISDIAIDDFLVLSGTECINADINEITGSLTTTEYLRTNTTTSSTTATSTTMERTTTGLPWSCYGRCGLNYLHNTCSCEFNCNKADICCTIGHSNVCANGKRCPIKPCCNDFVRICSKEINGNTTRIPNYATTKINFTIVYSTISNPSPSQNAITTESSSIATLMPSSTKLTDSGATKLTSNLTTNSLKYTSSTSLTSMITNTVNLQMKTTESQNYIDTSIINTDTSNSLLTTVNIKTTNSSYTEPKKLSFDSKIKPSLSAPILVAVIGLLTIATIITVFWVKKKQQSSLYNYSDIRSENQQNNEEPVQRNTSKYIPLGDDSLVHIDYE